jgi:glycine cleavage system transcriptional repressor
VYGGDKPGIVYKVSAMLAANHINITDVVTNVAGTAQAPLYIMLLEVELPVTEQISSLTQKLQKLAEEIKVTITINPLETAGESV